MPLSIQSVTIVNFQSHSETCLELAGKGCLTVITGPTDSGKTSIVRALKWVMYNQPAGTAFVRAGTTTASVTVELATGESVTRSRGRSHNEYRLLLRGSQGYAERVFEGFGAAVPLEVSQLLGTRPLQIGDLVILANLSEQLEPAFLGRGVSSTLRAKVLLKLAGSEVLDIAARRIGLDAYRAARERERCSDELRSIGQDIDRHEWLSLAASRIEAAERLIASIERRIQVAVECESLIKELASLPDPTLLTLKRKSAEEVLFRAAELDKRLAEKLDRLKQLRELLVDFEQVTRDAHMATGDLQRLRKALNDAEHGYQTLVGLLEFCPTCGQRLPDGGLDSGRAPGNRGCRLTTASAKSCDGSSQERDSAGGDQPRDD